MSFELILPFLRPIEPLLLDESVSEIMGNPDASWFCERDGKLCQEPNISFDAGRLRTGLEVIANQLGKKLDEDNPLLDAHLPDGSRLAAVIPPVVCPAPSLTIRKFTSRHYTIDDLIARGTLTRPLADFLAEQIRGGKTLLISGGTGTGKTTALDVIRRAAEARAYEVEGFAPTSRAAKQLREAGISAGTLQGFLVRRSTPDPANEKRLYLVDESSLTSAHHVKEFMHRLGPQDRVVLIGDIRQHQAVEAGKPFEQLQDAGMSTAKLEQIVRQTDPDLKAIVEHFARGEVSSGIQALAKQGRITEIGDAAERIRVIARSFVENPENTLVISPDNASRRQLNDAIRTELQSRGRVGAENHLFRVLIPQQDMTGADRRWAARYNVDDVLRYSRGSKSLGIRAGSYARVLSTNLPENLLTVETKSRGQVTYDPRRLTGVSIYRENEQRFAVGDRLQFVAPDKNIGVANRELGTIESISPRGDLTIRLEKGRRVELDPSENRHFDHGYAVTSHSAQGLTADRVLINADAKAHPDLVNSRFAYVAVSRAQSDARIYTDDRAAMEARLGTEISKSSALAPSVSLEQGAVRDLAITL